METNKELQIVSVLVNESLPSQINYCVTEWECAWPSVSMCVYVWVPLYTGVSPWDRIWLIKCHFHNRHRHRHTHTHTHTHTHAHALSNILVKCQHAVEHSEYLWRQSFVIFGGLITPLCSISWLQMWRSLCHQSGCKWSWWPFLSSMVTSWHIINCRVVLLMIGH